MVLSGSETHYNKKRSETLPSAHSLSNECLSLWCRRASPQSQQSYPSICMWLHWYFVSIFLWQFDEFDLFYIPRRRIDNLLLPKAATYPWRCVFLAPVRFRLAELCIAEQQLDFQVTNVRMFVWMIRFMTFFDVTEILNWKITYSRWRFDFPNTLVETREHHYGAWSITSIVRLVPVVNFDSSLLQMLSLIYIWLFIVYRKYFSR